MYVSVLQSRRFSFNAGFEGRFSLRQVNMADDDENDDQEEQLHFQRVIGSFVGYESVTMADVERTRRALARLTPSARRLLPAQSLDTKVAALQRAAQANARFLREVVDNQGSFPTPAGSRPREADHSKVRSTLHSVVRDWSREGEAERRQSYDPLLAELKRLVLPVERGKRARVLVPGAGLARLVLEVAVAGYASQGNEFSYHMLLCSNFFLNMGLPVESIPIYPFIDQPSNVRVASDRCRVVRVPDICPSDMLVQRDGEPPLDFSMAAGEFLEVYEGQDEQWDAVVTCFFVDTAPVAVDYVDAIFRLLKPGRPWINLGPLLYHWVPTPSVGDDVDDDRYSQSIELAWDELKHVILARGFRIVNEEWRSATYTANSRSMMRTQYDCLFFTAVKRSDAAQ